MNITTGSQSGALSALSYSVIIKLMYNMAYKLTMKQENVQKKVGVFMGGKVLDLPEIRIYHQGEADGMAKGEAVGMAKGEAERRKLEEEITQLREENERLRALQAVGK